jgi:cell division transport system ATP-binding protein
MIKFSKVTKVYPPDFSALQDVSFEVKEGEFVSIVGKSGAGKTTLIKLILGLEQPTLGEVYFKNFKIKDLNSKKLQEVRRQIGAIYQDYRLLESKTVFENVAYVMHIDEIENEDVDKEVLQVLELIGLKNKVNNFPSELSGGEQQRLAIARAVASHPEIIIADEPTGNLDPYNSYEVMSILKKINEAGKTVILASHDRDLINKIGKRVITIEDGRILRDDIQVKIII